MTIEIIGEEADKRPRVICPWCKTQMMANLDYYKFDMTKPVKSNCPHCGGEIYSCLILLAHKGLRELGTVMNTIVTAVEEFPDPLSPDSSKTLLMGDNN